MAHRMGCQDKSRLDALAKENLVGVKTASTAISGTSASPTENQTEISGVAPANQTKERSVHELFPGAFRNKSSM